MEKNDASLIRDYLEGEDKAFEVLTRRHLKSIYNFALRFTGRKEEAEDIAQETFFKVWKNIKSYREGENFKAWLFKIARNNAIDYFRKKKSLDFSDFEDEDGGNYFESNLPDLGPLPDEIIKKSEDGELAKKLLAGLAPKEREVIILHYYNGLTFQEIGEITAESLNTVKSRYRRALIKLREIIMHQN